jgi:3-dehydrosphinganine reductase
MRKFNQKIVYITGGSSGIGLEVACQLAAEGAHIAVFSSRPATSVQPAIEAARHSPGQRVACYVSDVADRQQVLTTVEHAVAEFGAPDLVLNCAGIGVGGEFLTVPYEGFVRSMEVNLLGTYHVCEAVVPLMQQRGHGTIALVGSMAGFMPVYGYSSYGTSKFAVVGFAECLRLELKQHGIDVVLICPGEVETPMIAHERATIHPATRALKRIGGNMPVKAVATKIVRGLASRRSLIVTGARNRLVYWLFRLTPPTIWNAVSDAIVASALRSKARPSTQLVADSDRNQGGAP